MKHYSAWLGLFLVLLPSHANVAGDEPNRNIYFKGKKIPPHGIVLFNSKVPFFRSR